MNQLTELPNCTLIRFQQFWVFDSEESVLGYGIGIILMNVGMHFVASVILVSKIRKIKI